MWFEAVALQQRHLVAAPAFETFGLAPEPDRVVDVIRGRKLLGGRIHGNTFPY
jgi:hypothetical protein